MTTKLLDLKNKIIEEIKTKGVCRITRHDLLEAFKISDSKNKIKNRRSPSNVAIINDFFCENGYYSLPKFTIDGKIDRISIYNYEHQQSTVRIKKEKELKEKIFDAKLLENLGIQIINDEIPPLGTENRIDILGKSKNGKQLFVIETKKDRNNKKGIEQLLRYSAFLKEMDEYKKRSFKLVLIVGEYDIATHYAIKGLHIEQQKIFDYYIYDWDGNNRLELKKIKI